MLPSRESVESVPIGVLNLLVLPSRESVNSVPIGVLNLLVLPSRESVYYMLGRTIAWDPLNLDCIQQ